MRAGQPAKSTNKQVFYALSNGADAGVIGSWRGSNRLRPIIQRVLGEGGGGGEGGGEREEAGGGGGVGSGGGAGEGGRGRGGG